MSMPFFSIIIPLYNKENYIQKTLNSILAQTFQDFEVIIVDDCSTDESVKKAKEIQSDKIRFVSHEQNKGLSASRNTGIRNAKAQFITFLDADDFWKSHFLEKIKELIETFPEAGLFATAYSEIYPGNLVIQPSVNKNDISEGSMLLIENFFERNLQQPIYNHSSVCLRKSVFDIVGFYNEKINFSEDVDFNIRANYYFRLAFCNDNEAGYNVYSENQITNSGISNKTIPDLDKYVSFEKDNPELKKYIDFERYVLALHCRLADRKKDFKKFLAGIDPKNLTLKQRILLRLPKSALRLIRKIKVYFLLKGYRLTTF
jgi:glycosyltransferase involved in cell wall biosynthesis